MGRPWAVNGRGEAAWHPTCSAMQMSFFARIRQYKERQPVASAPVKAFICKRRTLTLPARHA